MVQLLVGSRGGKLEVMRKTEIVLILLLNMSFMITDFKAENSSVKTVFNNASIVLETNCSSYAVLIPIKIIIDQNKVILDPKRNNLFIKEIVIPINNISSIRIVSSKYLQIYENGSCVYKLVLYKKDQLFNSIINNDLYSPEKTLNNLYAENINNNSKNKLILLFSGSTIFSPLNVDVKIEVNNNIVFISPKEYTCIFKDIEIKTSEIVKIKKRPFNKFIIKTQLKNKYKFKSKERNELVNQIKKEILQTNLIEKK